MAAEASSSVVRTRRCLDSLTTAERTALKKLLPKDVLKAPSFGPTKYPSIFISVLPEGEGYSLLGHIAETMLRMPARAIHMDMLLDVTEEFYPALDDKGRTKIAKSKTVPPFIASLVATRRQLKAAFAGEEPAFEPEITVGHLQGHPDAVAGTHIFEVKLAGQPEKDWLKYIYQVFSYAALLPESTHVHIVLPLSETIWSYDISGWKGRAAYMDILQTAAERAGGSAAAEAAAMIAARGIGSHVERRGGSLLKTLQGLTVGRPWQIFLGNPMSTKLALKDDDVAASAAHIAATGLRVFVHTPYLINLSAAGAGALLREQTTAAVAAGMSGVVVHVGKSVKMDVATATEAMRAALAEGAEAATAACPILLETPAGQGTELLTDWAEFVDFVASFADTRIRACVDTCHCFACGHCPLKYITDTIATYPGRIKLIHFNDSAVACGACVDRHAAPGTGHIGLETLSAIAAVAGEAGIPCVVE
jgi:deoxyribonuclease-4